MRDVQLAANGDLADRNVLTEDKATDIRQRVLLRLNRFAGEWFLDITTGLPFVEWRGQKPAQLGLIAATIRDEISAVDGVVGTQAFTARQNGDRVTIEGEYTIVGGVVDGVAITQAPEPPFGSAPWVILFGGALG